MIICTDISHAPGQTARLSWTFAWSVASQYLNTPCAFHKKQKLGLDLFYSFSWAKNTNLYIYLHPQDAVSKRFDWLTDMCKACLHWARGCFWSEPVILGNCIWHIVENQVSFYSTPSIWAFIPPWIIVFLFCRPLHINVYAAQAVIFPVCEGNLTLVGFIPNSSQILLYEASS